MRAQIFNMLANWATTRPRFIKARNRSRRLLARRSNRTILPGRSMRRRLSGTGSYTLGPFLQPNNVLARQPFDRVDSLAVMRSDDRHGGAGAAGAARATDAMHIVVRVMRDVEIEHVTDVRNIKP